MWLDKEKQCSKCSKWKRGKTEAVTAIDSWIKNHFKIQVHWDTDHQFDSKTFRLDSKLRTIASQLTAIAQESQATHPTPKPPISKPLLKPTPVLNACWVDLTRVKEQPHQPNTFSPPEKTTSRRQSHRHHHVRINLAECNYSKAQSYGEI